MTRSYALLAAGPVVCVSAFTIWLLSLPAPDVESIENRRGRIREIIADPEVREEDGLVSQNVHLRSDTGLKVEFCVLRPAGASDPLPLVVLLGGHRTGRDAVQLLGSPRGIVVAALNYPYEGLDRPRGVWQVLQTVGPARQALADTSSAVLLATDWLIAQSWVDATSVELMGVSMGVPFAAASAAVEPRFRRVWLVQGGAGLREWIEHNLESDSGEGPMNGLTARLIHRLARGSRFEPEYWVPLISPRPVVLIGARQDKRLPVELVERLEAAITGPKEVIWVDGDHIDREPEAVREILGLVLDRLESDPES